MIDLSHKIHVVGLVIFRVAVLSAKCCTQKL